MWAGVHRRANDDLFIVRILFVGMPDEQEDKRSGPEQAKSEKWAAQLLQFKIKVGGQLGMNCNFACLAYSMVAENFSLI